MITYSPALETAAVRARDIIAARTPREDRIDRLARLFCEGYRDEASLEAMGFTPAELADLKADARARANSRFVRQLADV